MLMANGGKLQVYSISAYVIFSKPYKSGCVECRLRTFKLASVRAGRVSSR